MNELLKRTFFGFLYAISVILALQSFLWTTVLLGFFLVIGLREFSVLTGLAYKTVLLPALFIYLTSFLYHYQTIDLKVIKIAGAFTLLVLFIPLIYFIFNKISLNSLALLYLTVFYVALPFSLALGIDSKLLLSIFFIIWASDTFAYLTGKNFGKHKLAEKISPKKTIEGVLGGLIGGLITAFVIFKYSGWKFTLNLQYFLLLTLIIVIFGTLGDLLESRFKRLANVKDSGNIIPGHGGILDRLDSFILAVPFVYIFLLII